MKKISDSERLLVGWGRDGDRLCYFISHKKVKDSPICCDPEDLKDKMKKIVDFVDTTKFKEKTKHRREK